MGGVMLKLPSNDHHWRTQYIQLGANAEAGRGRGRHTPIYPLRRTIGSADRDIAIKISGGK